MELKDGLREYKRGGRLLRKQCGEVVGVRRPFCRRERDGVAARLAQRYPARPALAPGPFWR